MYALRYRGQYPEAVAMELEAMLTADKEWKTLEHSDEGAHASESTGAAIADLGLAMAAGRVLGRGEFSGDGDPEALTVGAGLEVAGTRLGIADYVVTTWTPSDGSGAGLSFSNVEGRYIRLGSLIVAMGTVTYPVTANASAAVIGGLPVTSANTTRRQASGLVVNDAAVSLAYQVNVNATTARLVSSTALTTVPNNALSGAVLSFTVIYTA